uniref:Uncharacterized protein n=1 Tax=Oxyrrhis marina TaxID=2969 RepID=A0A7S3UP26_OXYMA
MEGQRSSVVFYGTKYIPPCNYMISTEWGINPRDTTYVKIEVLRDSRDPITSSELRVNQWFDTYAIDPNSYDDYYDFINELYLTFSISASGSLLQFNYTASLDILASTFCDRPVYLEPFPR